MLGETSGHPSILIGIDKEWRGAAGVALGNIETGVAPNGD
jgi:hypothetical protein